VKKTYQLFKTQSKDTWWYQSTKT